MRQLTITIFLAVRLQNLLRCGLDLFAELGRVDDFGFAAERENPRAELVHLVGFERKVDAAVAAGFHHLVFAPFAFGDVGL